MRPTSSALAFVLLLAPALLGGCSALSVFEAPTTIRGNKVDADQLKELTVGTSTRQDAQSLLGSPTARGTFDDNTWFYISEVTQTRIARTPGVRDQEVVVLNFDQGGILRDIRRVGPDAARDVAMVGRSTPSPGSEASFMQQLLGNIGRFSPGSLPGQTSTPGGSGANSP